MHAYIRLKLEMYILETGEKENWEKPKVPPTISITLQLPVSAHWFVSFQCKTLWISLNSNIPSLLEVSLLKGFRMSLIMKENNLKISLVLSQRGVGRNSILYLFLSTYNVSSVFYLNICFNHTSISESTWKLSRNLLNPANVLIKVKKEMKPGYREQKGREWNIWCKNLHEALYRFI